MQILDLIIMADRWCPTSRTYLTYLSNAGYKPRKIILVDFIGPNARLKKLRKFFGSRLASSVIRRDRAQWPDYAPLIKDYCQLVQKDVEYPVDYFAPFDYHDHCQELQEVAAEDYDDPYLHKLMRRQKIRRFLYTNGGRVPNTLLRQADLKILHIHPGVLPFIRGSDGLFWSIAVRGKPGVSCFYMDAGIDTGSLIATKEFPLPKIPAPAPKTMVEEDALYRALLLAYDPHLRASLFRDIVVNAKGDLTALVSQPQDRSVKDNYLWMHPLLRLKIMKGMLCES